MKRLDVAWALLATSLLAAGCGGEPIEGDWETAQGACADEQKDRFTIDGDLSGAGDFVLACSPDTEEALFCSAHLFAMDSSREDMWTLEAQFGYCASTDQDYGRRFKDCAVLSDGEMTCCDPDGRNCTNYVRIGD